MNKYRIISIISFTIAIILLISMLFKPASTEIKPVKSVSQTTLITSLDETLILPDWRDDEYHDYAGTTQMLDSFNSEYPKLVDVFSIGQSVQKRDIWCIKITNEQNKNSKYSCVIDGCIHGCEWEAGEACLYLANYLLINYGSNDTISKILNNTEVYIIPLVNPDGREKDERWNDNGIDLNRNFDVHFGRIRGGSIPLGKILGIIKISYIERPKIIETLGLDKYIPNKYWTNSGRYAFSEPETKALSDFMKTLRSSLSFYLNCHTAMHGVTPVVNVDYKPEYIASQQEKKVYNFAEDWIGENTEYLSCHVDDVSFPGAGFAHHWVFKEFRIPSFCFEMLSTDYEPMWGGGRHDHLTHWMKTTLPVFMYLLVNAENLYNWETPENVPVLPEDVPPIPI
jgi:hypothetical protein